MADLESREYGVFYRAGLPDTGCSGARWGDPRARLQWTARARLVLGGRTCLGNRGGFSYAPHPPDQAKRGRDQRSG